MSKSQFKTILFSKYIWGHGSMSDYNHIMRHIFSETSHHAASLDVYVLCYTPHITL